tara:strand:- start:3363 stop:3527 length:165 start_codon:yes stop_codon:yes gene_type:complete
MVQTDFYKSESVREGFIHVKSGVNLFVGGNEPDCAADFIETFFFVFVMEVKHHT